MYPLSYVGYMKSKFFQKSQNKKAKKPHFFLLHNLFFFKSGGVAVSGNLRSRSVSKYKLNLLILIASPKHTTLELIMIMTPKN
jgi:hypothetical protein